MNPIDKRADEILAETYQHLAYTIAPDDLPAEIPRALALKIAVIEGKNKMLENELNTERMWK